MSKLKKAVKATEVKAARGEADTLRVWESYQDQALMWRAIALFQLPGTFAALVFAIMMYVNRKIILDVPLKPAPGQYSVDQLKDPEFIDVATEFVNLIGTYQPFTARRQFIEAQQKVVEPLLSKFNSDIMDTELRAIEATQRTQLFFADPQKTTVARGSRDVTVTLEGDRMKVVAGKEFPSAKYVYQITMETRPRNRLNPYGIVVTSITSDKKTYQ